MFTNEGTNQYNNADYAFVAINGALIKLATASNATVASVPYSFSTDASASSVTLAFGVVD